VKVTVNIPTAEYRRMSDEELIRRFNELHEVTPVYHLFERYGHLVLGVCLKYTDNPHNARKLTEDLYLKMLGRIKSFHGKETFKPWLFAYLENYGLADAESKIQLSPEFVAAQDKKILEDAVAQLPQEQKICVELYEQNKSYDDVARATGYPIQRIKNLLNIGWQRMRTYFQAHSYKHHV
jgi:RNA polymerase sigma factor (sigma-70 family)